MKTNTKVGDSSTLIEVILKHPQEEKEQSQSTIIGLPMESPHFALEPDMGCSSLKKKIEFFNNERSRSKPDLVIN